MAEQTQFEELGRQFSAIGAVHRDLRRVLPHDCPSGSAAVLTLLGRYGDMRMSKLAELLSVDMSVTSRSVGHVVDRGWVERSPDPADKRSRILRLTPAGHAMVDDLARRTTDLLAERLSDWTDDEVGLLIRLMARLKDSFGDCRPPHARAHHPSQSATAPAAVPAPAPAPTSVLEATTTRTPA
ncbi:MarR family winged helix-turn-helix transcriptional regulator [Streptomyces sp. NPDC002514]|uniref:MarR family winged helix-turn-helix transcriptional regulator n=1 Tax=unclassified Streptomyces TaxID=2593676 RepID=UPI0036BFCE18